MLIEALDFTFSIVQTDITTQPTVVQHSNDIYTHRFQAIEGIS